MKCAGGRDGIRTGGCLPRSGPVSCHVHPYHPDYLNHILNPAARWTASPIWDGKAVISRAGDRVPHAHRNLVPRRSDFYDETGAANTYLAYLRALRRHHTMPVVISEFGVSTGAHGADRPEHTDAIRAICPSRSRAGARGLLARHHRRQTARKGCVFTLAVTMVQAHRSHLGARGEPAGARPTGATTRPQRAVFRSASFDPGAEECIAYVDGDLGVDGGDKLFDTGTRALSMKYDEKFIYLLAYEKGLRTDRKRLAIPIDTTPKTGSTYCENFGLRFEDPVTSSPPSTAGTTAASWCAGA